MVPIPYWAQVPFEIPGARHQRICNAAATHSQQLSRKCERLHILVLRRIVDGLNDLFFTIGQMDNCYFEHRTAKLKGVIGRCMLSNQFL
jgi:hypothetical protein